MTIGIIVLIIIILLILFFNTSVRENIENRKKNDNPKQQEQPQKQQQEQPKQQQEQPQKQPAVQQPVVQQPVVQQPVVQQPVVQQPVVQQPAVQQPAVQQPVVQQPAVQQPAVQQPAVQQPAVQQPVVQPQSQKIAVTPAPIDIIKPSIKLVIESLYNSNQKQVSTDNDAILALNRVHTYLNTPNINKYPSLHPNLMKIDDQIIKLNSNDSNYVNAIYKILNSLIDILDLTLPKLISDSKPTNTVVGSTIPTLLSTPKPSMPILSQLSIPISQTQNPTTGVTSNSLKPKVTLSALEQDIDKNINNLFDNNNKFIPKNMPNMYKNLKNISEDISKIPSPNPSLIPIKNAIDSIVPYSPDSAGVSYVVLNELNKIYEPTHPTVSMY
jgi:hypothetical protein